MRVQIKKQNGFHRPKITKEIKVVNNKPVIKVERVFCLLGYFIILRYSLGGEYNKTLARVVNGKALFYCGRGEWLPDKMGVYKGFGRWIMVD